MPGTDPGFSLVGPRPKMLRSPIGLDCPQKCTKSGSGGMGGTSGSIHTRQKHNCTESVIFAASKLCEHFQSEPCVLLFAFHLFVRCSASCVNGTQALRAFASSTELSPKSAQKITYFPHELKIHNCPCTGDLDLFYYAI